MGSLFHSYLVIIIAIAFFLGSIVVEDAAMVLNAAVRGEIEGDNMALSFINSWVHSVSYLSSCVCDGSPDSLLVQVLVPRPQAWQRARSS